MRRFTLLPYAYGIGVACALLAGCGGSEPPTVAPGADPQTRALPHHPSSSGQPLLYAFGS